MADNTIGWGQAHINNTISFGGDVSCGGSSYTGLFNEFGSPAFGASVRLLDNTYTDGLVRVRAYRVIGSGGLDQGEADVLPDPSSGYFISLNSPITNLDATATVRGLTDSDTLGDLLSSGVDDYDGFVTTWYDQSGNAQHLEKTVATTQPLIAINGSLVTFNGKPYITSNEEERWLEVETSTLLLNGSNYTSFTNLKYETILSTFRFITYADRNFIGSTNGYLLIGQDASTSTIISNVATASNYRVDDTPFTPVDRNDIYDNIFNVNNRVVSFDFSPTATWQSFGINNYGGAFSNGMNSFFNESIIYNAADVSGNISNINQNIIAANTI